MRSQKAQLKKKSHFLLIENSSQPVRFFFLYLCFLLSVCERVRPLPHAKAGRNWLFLHRVGRRHIGVRPHLLNLFNPRQTPRHEVEKRKKRCVVRHKSFCVTDIPRIASIDDAVIYSSAFMKFRTFMNFPPDKPVQSARFPFANVSSLPFRSNYWYVLYTSRKQKGKISWN